MQTQSFRVKPDQAGVLLQEFVGARLGCSRSKAKAMIDSRLVFVNGRRVWMARHALKAGDTVELPVTHESSRRPVSIRILFENADFVVADKPVDCLSNGNDSVESVLRVRMGLPALAAIHRLDRDTSGCLLLAKHQDAFDRTVEQFRQHRVLKIYHAIAAGRLNGPEMIIDKPLDGEPAVTRLRVVDSSPLASHLTVRIDTGRTHQIRKHLESNGHPVLGDKAYGSNRVVPPELRGIERQMLHAQTLQFESLVDGTAIRVVSPLPDDFTGLLRRLRLT